MDTAQTEKLKALALAAQKGGDIFTMWDRLCVFQSEANPATVLELIADNERLRAELAGRGQNSAKPSETRMAAAFEGGPSGSAPAAGTEKDADPMAAAGQKMAAWLHGLSKSGLPCRSWSRTCAELAQQWDCVAAAHKAREGA